MGPARREGPLVDGPARAYDSREGYGMYLLVAGDGLYSPLRRLVYSCQFGLPLPSAMLGLSRRLDSALLSAPGYVG